MSQTFLFVHSLLSYGYQWLKSLLERGRTTSHLESSSMQSVIVSFHSVTTVRVTFERSLSRTKTKIDSHFHVAVNFVIGWMKY